MLKLFLSAVAILAGTIIGVGIFGLPYVASKVGFGVVLIYFLVLGVLVTIIHLLFGEVALRSKIKRRLPGYAEEYLGKTAKRITFFSTIFGLTGVLLSYIIIGGEFLFSLLSPILGGHYLIYIFIFFSAGAWLIYTGIENISKTQLILLALFFVVMFVIFGRSFNYIEIRNLLTFDANYIFLPYGIVLFSLWGMALIPEVKEMLRGKEKLLKSLITISISLAVITCLFFIFLVLGVTGEQTSREAIYGLREVFGDWIVKLAFVFGILTCFTSFITLGLTLKKVYWYDFGISKNFSWLLACFIPLILYFLGLRDFIKVISITGAVMLGIEGVIVILMHAKAKFKGKVAPAYSIFIPKWLRYSLILFLVLGIAYEIFHLVV